MPEKKKNFKQRIRHLAFLPYFPLIFINPYYIIRSSIYLSIRELAPLCLGDVLDVGCGSKPYRSLFKNIKYIGIDVKVSGHNHYNSDVDTYFDGVTIPFTENSFDSIVSFEVFEHVPNIDSLLAEISRVLKPEGTLLVSTPFVWDEHELPYDFRRYTRGGLSEKLGQHGFKEIKSIKTTHALETIAQLLVAYINQTYLKKYWFLKYILSPVISAPILLLGKFFSIFPDNRGLYLNTVAIFRKTTNGA